MSTTQNVEQIRKPPARGSFPLDHEGVCKEFAERYIECMRTLKKEGTASCRKLSREYLECRMNK
jgi:cytochrome c oxidase assembly protein subunit 19